MKSIVNVIRRNLIAQTCKNTRLRMSHQWGYEHSELPPAEWHRQYPIAKGKNQSPINLKTDSIEHKQFPEFHLGYKESDVKSVSNNGHSVTFQYGKNKSTLSGGPLNTEYTLEQFHFHWGSNSSQGSEHLLDGKSFAAEIHLVHWNSGKYNSFADSLGHADGLCVLGAFIEAGHEDNADYKEVMKNVSKVPLKGNQHNIEVGFNLRKLLPEDIKCYFHYPGSLTTPPLKECVQWVVFKQPVLLSENQLSVFRSLHTGDDSHSSCLCDNYRPVQHLYDRKVLSS